MAIAIMGCVFGILGIFTLGIVFVPIAALCTLGALLEGLTRRSASIVFLSLINLVLTIVGLSTSPILLVVIAGILGGGVNKTSVSANNGDHKLTTTSRMYADPFQFCEQMNNCPPGHVHHDEQ